MIWTKELGELIVTTSGDSLWSRGVQKSVRVKLLATVQPETIERSLDGRITYASRAFLALYDPLAWPNDELGLMYTDSQVPQQINLFLRQEHGFQHEVCWSEQGAQQSDAADFDTDPAMIEEIWPDLIDHRRLTNDDVTLMTQLIDVHRPALDQKCQEHGWDPDEVGLRLDELMVRRMATTPEKAAACVAEAIDDFSYLDWLNWAKPVTPTSEGKDD